MIRIEGVVKRFEARTILDRLTVTLDRGKVSALVGPSGCGKSTLLRCINGLERFEAGQIVVGDLTIGPAAGSTDRADRALLRKVRTRVGMVFQQYGLFAHMTALANVVEAPVHVLGLPKADATARAKALLEKVGLGHRRDAFPRELSGGEQQRVAIARALAMGPEALLLDEPTSALDPERKRAILKLLGAIAAEGTTMILVTHEAAVARALADRAIVLRDGKVAADGPPKDVFDDDAASRASVRPPAG